MADEKLGPDDPTPDPEKVDPVDAVAETEGAPSKGTTFVDVEKLKEAAKEAVDAVDVSDGVQAEEVVDAAIGAAGKLLGDESGEHPPLTHHAISELRKGLVHLVAIIIAAGAGGGFGAWRAEGAKVEAVKQVELKIQQAEEKRAEIERIRTEVRKALLEKASWDEVGATLEVDEEAAIRGIGGITAGGAGTPPALDMDQLKELVHSEAQQIQAQVKLPPRPLLADEPNMDDGPQPASPH
jgi:hypothetical protein